MGKNCLIFEDEHLLVIEKPSGIPSAPLPKSDPDEVTAVTAALALCPNLPEGFSEHERGLLHRLDTDTSGLLLFAKDRETFLSLREKWTSIRKTYQALILLEPGQDFPNLPLDIRYDLAHSAKSSKRMIALDEQFTQRRSWKGQIRGRPLAAHTRILSAETLGMKKLLTIEISSGAMHQIRCHLAAIDFPILGDKIYGGASAPRLMLHHLEVEIPNYKKGESKSLTLSSSLPEVFRNL